MILSLSGKIRAFLVARGAEREMNRGGFATARTMFAESLALFESPQARVKMSLCMWETGDRAKAVEEGTKAGKALPPGSPARLFLALVLVEEGRFDEAARIVTEVRAADRGNPFASGIEALAMLKKGKAREAGASLGSFVFGSPVFRAHLLAAIEQRLLSNLPRKKWVEEYLECVL